MTVIRTAKKLRPRSAHDFYETPARLCTKAVENVPFGHEPSRILDPGAGRGPWGKAARIAFPDAHIVGVESQRDFRKPVGYDEWIKRDFLRYSDGAPFDLILGNPPFAKAEEFVRHGLELLQKGGYLLYLLRLAFLESEGRALGLWREFPPLEVYVLANRVPFYGGTKTDDTAYALYLWRKGTHARPSLNWLSWNGSKRKTSQ